MSTAAHPEGQDSRQRSPASPFPQALASDSLYELLFELLPCSVVLIDTNGHLLDANPSFCRQIGFARTELIGVHVSRFSRDSTETIQENLRRLLNGEVLQHSVSNIRKDGSLRHYELRETAITLRDGTRAILAISDDVTDRRQAEQEKLTIERQLLHTEKLQSLGVMASGIAHLFNNLLGATLGNIDLARLELPPSSPVHAYLEGAVKATRSAADLTRQMMAFSGHSRLALHPLSLNDTIRQMLDLLKVSMPARGVLEVELATNLPRIEADAGQIHQLLINLVTNAAEALPRGTGSITISTRMLRQTQPALTEGVWQGQLQAGDWVALEVRDTGSGMDASTQARLFEPFFTTKFLGRGLGMAAVLGIVRAHRGAIQILSTPGSGTAVTSFFPALPTIGNDGLETASDATKTGGELPGNLQGAVLLVQEERPARMLLESTLSHAGLRVIPLSNGEEAVRHFRQHAHEIAFVLLDLAQPGMDGWRTLTELRRIQPEAKVILTSSQDVEHVRERATKAGALAILQKPCDLGRLLRFAQECCRPST